MINYSSLIFRLLLVEITVYLKVGSKQQQNLLFQVFEIDYISQNKITIESIVVNVPAKFFFFLIS